MSVFGTTSATPIKGFSTLAFDLLRKHYWPRRQFVSHQVIVEQANVEAIDMLNKLGFLV